MDDVLWRQHPSVFLRIGHLVVITLLAVVLASGFFWLPRLGAPGSSLEPGLTAVAWWLPLVLIWPLLRWCEAWLRSRTVLYQLTAQRLMISRGWFSARIDNLELYRVREMHIELPLLPRLCGVGNLVLRTIDHTEPEVVLSGIRRPQVVFEQLRDLVEACRHRTGLAGLS